MTSVDETNQRVVESPSVGDEAKSGSGPLALLARGYQAIEGAFVRGQENIMQAITRQVDKLPPSSPISKAWGYIQGDKYREIAFKYAIGDSLVTLSGRFTPADKEGEGRSGMKSLAGMLGLANSVAWAMFGEDSNDKVIGHLDSELAEVSDPEAKKARLQHLAQDWSGQEAAMRTGQKLAGGLGNLLFTASAAAMAASGSSRGNQFELANGGVNMVAYTAKGLRDWDVPGFGELYEMPERGALDPRTAVDQLRFNTAQTQSRLGIFTTLMGALSGVKDLMSNKVPLLGGLFQLAASVFYWGGDADLASTENKDTIRWEDRNLAKMSEEERLLYQRGNENPRDEAAVKAKEQIVARINREELIDGVLSKLRDHGLIVDGPSQDPEVIQLAARYVAKYGLMDGYLAAENGNLADTIQAENVQAGGVAQSQATEVPLTAQIEAMLVERLSAATPTPEHVTI